MSDHQEALTIVEKEAIDFAEDLFFGDHHNTRAALKSEIETQLYTLSRYQDKYSFLNVLRVKIKEQIEEHKPNCRKGTCGYEDEREQGLYAVDELIDDISPFVEKINTDKFTPSEQSEMYQNIIIILDEIKKTHAGQEVLYNEINDLKDYINLGRKGFGSMVAGKVTEMVAGDVIDRAFGQKIYDMLSRGTGDFLKLLNGG